MVALVSCRCGAVRGHVTDAAPDRVNRVVCYCDDCQAFAHWLGRPDLLDAKGGSDIVQVAPASLTFTSGQDRIAGVRLTSKGLHRFYARCCKTPLGNTVSPAIPFVGVHVEALSANGQDPDAAFGKPIGAIKGEYAVGSTPAGSNGIPVRLFLRAVSKVLGWRLTGKARPHPFFAPGRSRAVYPMTVLNADEREHLRPLCGPAPS